MLIQVPQKLTEPHVQVGVLPAAKTVPSDSQFTMDPLMMFIDSEATDDKSSVAPCSRSVHYAGQTTLALSTSITMTI